MTIDPNATGMPPELLDELCSADLDGELEAACADLGVTVDDARAAIATRGDRREALRAAGASVAADLDGDELDELERRRMSRAAVARASRPHASTRRRYIALGGAVAAIAAVAIGIAVTRGDNKSHDAARSGPGRPTIVTFDVGTVTDGRDLAQKLHADGGPFGTANKSPTTAPEPSKDATTGVSSSEARCLAKFPLASRTKGLRIVATAHLDGKRIVVATGSLNNGLSVVWGFRPADCSTAVSVTSK